MFAKGVGSERYKCVRRNGEVLGRGKPYRFLCPDCTVLYLKTLQQSTELMICYVGVWKNLGMRCF